MTATAAPKLTEPQRRALLRLALLGAQRGRELPAGPPNRADVVDRLIGAGLAERIPNDARTGRDWPVRPTAAGFLALGGEWAVAAETAPADALTVSLPAAAPVVAPVVASAIAAEYAGDIRAGLAAARLTPAEPAPPSAAETVRRAGIHVVDVEHVAPGAVRLTVQPGNGRHAAAALIRAGWDASTAHDETGTRVLAVTPEPAGLVDLAPAETYGTAPGQTWPPQASRYAGRVPL